MEPEMMQVVDAPKATRQCDLCGYPHFFPISIYVDWIERFGQWHIFKEGKKAGRPTMRTAQTQRWEAIVAKHSFTQDKQAGGLL